MIQWIRDSINRQREGIQQKDREWEAWIGKETWWLCMPHRAFRQEQWDSWGKMQASVLRHFRQHWQNTHVYIRFRSHLTWDPKAVLTANFEKISTTEQGEQIFIFPDCEEQSALEIILASYADEPLTRTIFLLDHKPEDWRQVVSRLFEIAVNLSSGQSAAEFESDLSICRCLCYSMDEELVIPKVDLTESDVLSILEHTAREEYLDLVLHRQD